MKTGIIIITYNIDPAITIKQVECIRRFCKDEPDIIIVDNSSLPECAEATRYHAGQMKVEYVKTQAASLGGSDSHCFAANVSYLQFKDRFSYLLYLDHDNIPIKEFSVKEVLGNKVMAGIGQIKEGVQYVWAGCVFLNNDMVDHSLVDFSTNHELRLDTGGNLYKIIERYGEENCIFFNEAYHQNPNFNKSFYNFYTLINDGMFFHMVNASNWANSEGHVERMNSLMSILQERLDNA